MCDCFIFLRTFGSPLIFCTKFAYPEASREVDESADQEGYFAFQAIHASRSLASSYTYMYSHILGID